MRWEYFLAMMMNKQSTHDKVGRQKGNSPECELRFQVPIFDRKKLSEIKEVCLLLQPRNVPGNSHFIMST